MGPNSKNDPTMINPDTGKEWSRDVLAAANYDAAIAEQTSRNRQKLFGMLGNNRPA